ncbi:hypothetical protein L6R52_11490 [Myxococcota bacterium]|nr:hypothetical protein [Myxococcota bacterium]
MQSVILSGMNGSNPLGFLASLGVLRVAHVGEGARLSFLDDGTFRPVLDSALGEKEIAEMVAADAERAGIVSPWTIEYEKVEKNGSKMVRDLKPPPGVFSRFARSKVAEWVRGQDEGAGYAAAFATSVAVDGKGNTKPTAFHFTAANQTFLKSVEESRGKVSVEWARESLFAGGATRPGPNLRWDPSAERNWALMANNPNDEGTSVDAPLEWLAFRSLPLVPSFPVGTRIMTTAVTGRGDDMTFTWPLWATPCTVPVVRSLLQLDHRRDSAVGKGRTIFAVCESRIRRTAQGFGNFSPAVVGA